MTTLRERVEAQIQRQPKFDRWPVPPLDEALLQLVEKVEEWEYSDDQHGWCHERTTLLAVLDALTRPGTG